MPSKNGRPDPESADRKSELGCGTDVAGQRDEDALLKVQEASAIVDRHPYCRVHKRRLIAVTFD
jgi:hypothetical protein